MPDPQPLGKRASVIAGQSPEGSYYNNSGHGLPFYQGKKDFGERELQPPTVWTSRTTKEAQAGDILMSVRAPVGPINFARDRVCIGRGLAAIRCRDGLDPDFLFYQLLGMQADIAGKEGAVFASINKAEIEALPIVVPAVDDQRRIVAILDEAFEGIATAKANAEKNLQNARELFDGYLQGVFSQRNPGWIQRRLQDVCEKITDGTHQTPKYFDSGVVFLSSRNVTSGRIDWENIKYIDEKQHFEMHRRVAPRVGDILLAKNGTTGVAAIVDRDTMFDIYVSLAMIRSRGAVLPRYLLRFINSPAAKEQFNKRLKGIGVPNLHLEEIREVLVQFPESLEEQQKVIDQLDELHEEVEDIGRLQRRKLTALHQLKESLLHQAFTGVL